MYKSLSCEGTSIVFSFSFEGFGIALCSPKQKLSDKTRMPKTTVANARPQL